MIWHRSTRGSNQIKTAAQAIIKGIAEDRDCMFLMKYQN